MPPLERRGRKGRCYKHLALPSTGLPVSCTSQSGGNAGNSGQKWKWTGVTPPLREKAPKCAKPIGDQSRSFCPVCNSFSPLCSLESEKRKGFMFTMTFWRVKSRRFFAGKRCTFQTAANCVLVLIGLCSSAEDTLVTLQTPK